jgi:hypothetical protein
MSVDLHGMQSGPLSPPWLLQQAVMRCSPPQLLQCDHGSGVTTQLRSQAAQPMHAGVVVQAVLGHETWTESEGWKQYQGLAFGEALWLYQELHQGLWART